VAGLGLRDPKATPAKLAADQLSIATSFPDGLSMSLRRGSSFLQEAGTVQR
jgi:hypothetical protein